MNILAMSGFVPRQICDVIRFNGFDGENNINHYCGYASDFIARVKNDKSIDGVVFPKSCDSSRVILSYLQEIDKFKYQLHIPARHDDKALAFFAKQLEDYKLGIERYYDINIHDVRQRCEKLNENIKDIQEKYHNLEDISYYNYLKAIYDNIDKPLVNNDIEWEGLDSDNNCHKKVFIIGSSLSNIGIAKKIEDAGMKIVGDNLPDSGRAINRPLVDVSDSDLYYQIANNVLGNALSPTQNDFSKILNNDLLQIKSKSVNGVIFITQKYCEAYDYLYSCYKKALDEINIPVLKVDLLNSRDESKVELKIEAFADVL